jgi:hypothetical protein
VTARDRIVLMVVVGAALIAGFWFVVLAPKRDESTKLDAKVAVAQQRLQQAQTVLVRAEKAKRGYESDYATVARLGKAVPKDDNMPSLLYELQSAARGARVDFRTLEISGATQGGAPPAPTAPAAPSASGAATPQASQSAAAALPPGASVGSAGLPTIPFQFTFRGSYSDMEHLLHEVQRFVSVHGKELRVHGRLLTIDGLALVPQTFPRVKATITATAYLLPPDGGGSAGSSTQAAGASGSADQPGSSSPPKVTTPTATAKVAG